MKMQPKVNPQAYPQKRRTQKSELGWDVFCSSHAQQILISSELPARVHEALIKRPPELKTTGYQLITPETRPDILNQGELMLWPMGDVPIVRPGKKTTGDFFRCQFEHPHGNLYQGDSLAWLKTLPEASVNLVFADPPYNLGKAEWDTFESHSVYVDWCVEWIREVSRILTPTGTFYVCGFSEILADIKCHVAPFFKGCRWLIWHYKNKANLGNDWGRSHESIVHFRKSATTRLNVDDIRIPYGAHTLKYPSHPQAETSAYGRGAKGKHDNWTPHPGGAKPKDVFDIPTTCNGMGEKTPHPTQKPEELLRKLVLASSQEGERVLDPFSGSGTTLVVAEQLNRHWLGCDLSEEYNDWAIERIRNVPRRTLEEWIQLDRNTAARRESIREWDSPEDAAKAETAKPSSTASIDQRRRAVSSLTSDATKAQLGQFMTPSRIAQYLASLFDEQQGGDCHLLDPGAGIGSLTNAFLDNTSLCFSRVSVAACEIDARLAADLAQTLGAVQAEIVQADFVETAVNWLQFEPQKRFTHVIMNPPYRKIASSSAARLLLRQVDIETVNLYSAFVALSIKLLKKGGQLVAIVPRSFCNGPYYRPFRKLILSECAIAHIHLFGSRKSAFKDDKVLQENVVIKLIKEAGQRTVDISLSTDDSFADYEMHTHAFSRIVAPDDLEVFINIPTTEDQNRLDALSGANCALEDVGISVSTGPVVDFRVKDHLRQNPEPGTVPLLYPTHCAMNGCAWPKTNGKKPNALAVDEQTRKSLFPLGFYCVVKRFSSKEEKRRITASVVAPGTFKGHAALAFENHLNVFHEAKAGIPEALAYGLAVYLNTSFVDNFFRRFNGHTQVNATDLRQLRYPSRETLVRIGKWAMQQKDLTQVCMNDHVQEVLA
jgi:DNA modification methylase/predicted RNA methylase